MKINIVVLSDVCVNVRVCIWGAGGWGIYPVVIWYV